MESRREPIDLLDEAAVCGRFQPLHNEHLDYILESKRRARRLWVGLVSPSQANESPIYRLTSSANPLTYEERAEMILAALSEENIPRDDIVVVPFDIERAANIPVEIPMLITKCDSWSDQKEGILRLNYRVQVLKHRTGTQITGSRIRDMILKGDDSWMSLVPAATARLVTRLDLRTRLQSLVQNETMQ